MIGVSYGSKTMGINVGGPSLKLRMKDFKIGVGAFPSLIIADELTQNWPFHQLSNIKN